MAKVVDSFPINKELWDGIIEVTAVGFGFSVGNLVNNEVAADGVGLSLGNGAGGGSKNGLVVESL